MTWLAAHDHSLSDLGALELLGVGLAAIVTLWVIWKAVVYTFRPGEEDPGHIKRLILDEETERARADASSGGTP
ncbi:MAG: hypothetical protein ACYTG6_05755 [Planctomycetota bacterium]